MIGHYRGFLVLLEVRQQRNNGYHFLLKMKLWLSTLKTCKKIWAGPGRFALVLLTFMSVIAVYEGLGGKPCSQTVMAAKKTST
jgi:hypothetical protein